jgi:Tfp pilus assembly protein PilO
MSRNSDLRKFGGSTGLALWLRIGVAALALLNGVAIYLYIVPPGGSRHQLLDQEASIKRNIQLHHAATERLRTVSTKVELGGTQTDQFAQKYFLPHRTAYAVLIDELLRMSNAAGLREGQRTYSQEPIEGTDDLTLLTINANYQGSFADLMKFVNQVDHSDQLLILDTLTATPIQQGTGMLNVVTRFLAIVKEDGTAAGGTLGGQP